jgi:lysosomal acid lipase/cholesteryl ester hydrolase
MHLYSFTSTKSVVHWFQIIRNKNFQFFDDEIHAPFSIVASERFYKPVKYPTRNIKTPIVLLYGDSDSLVDINVMLEGLPRGTVAKPIATYEHLDFLWASDVDCQVFGHVFDALETHSANGPVPSEDTPADAKPNGKYLLDGRASNTSVLRSHHFLPNKAVYGMS